MEKMLFKFEMRKIFSQMSTKIIFLILVIFPIIFIVGLTSPTDQFSVSIAEFSNSADFSNAILGFLCTTGFHYIILAILSSSILSREIESKYLYFMLSVIPNATKLFFYKTLVVSVIYTLMLTLSSIIGYVGYSIFYVKKLAVTTEDIKIMSWGIFISFFIVTIYTLILTICNILCDGSIFATLTTSIVFMVLLLILGGIKNLRDYLPAWQTDYIPERIVLIFVSDLVILMLFSALVCFCARKKRF